MAWRNACTALLVLALSGAAFAEENEIGSPYDKFNAPKEECALVAVLPPKKQAPNATTSAFFRVDGKPHYIACSRKGEGTETFLYFTRQVSKRKGVALTEGRCANCSRKRFSAT